MLYMCISQFYYRFYRQSYYIYGHITFKEANKKKQTEEKE